MIPSLFRKSDPSSSNPWIFFFIFLASNTLLSFFPLSPDTKLWFEWIGIALPFVWALVKTQPLQFTAPAPASEGLIPTVSNWIWIALFTLSVLERLYKLTTLSTWPTTDEGLYGCIATQLSENWKWCFSYSYAQCPPFFVWGLGGFFKLFGPSLGSLWMFPALVSILTLPLAYSAARTFFSKSFAFLYVCIWAFNFVPLFLSRLCLGHGVGIFWEFACIALLGRLWRSPSVQVRKKAGVVLGILSGLGLYILPHWPVMVIFIFSGVLAVTLENFKNQKGALIAFLIFFIFTSIPYFPYLALFFSADHGDYLKTRWVFQSGLIIKDQLHLIVQYLGALFWGIQTNRYAYKPFWGGFMNPMAGALFFLGLISILRGLGKNINLWIIFGLGLFLLPALLSCDLEMLRMLLVFPLLLAVCAMGLSWLSQQFSYRPLGLAVTFMILVISAGLDLYHLCGPYQGAWHSDSEAVILSCKSMERFQAYQRLRSMVRAQGPGLIFTEFESTPFEQSLATAVYPFNAARNPRLSPEKAGWVGILTNINYAPFLSRRFPNSRWFPLISNDAVPQGTLVLGISPITTDNKKDFQSWLETERSLHTITSQLFNLPFGEPPVEVQEKLIQLEPSARNDPFLESCIMERMFFTGMSCSDYSRALDSLSRCLQWGYPAANLYNDLGVLWYTVGDRAKAREAFQASLRAPVNHTSAQFNLQAMGPP